MEMINACFSNTFNIPNLVVMFFQENNKFLNHTKLDVKNLIGDQSGDAE